MSRRVKEYAQAFDPAPFRLVGAHDRRPQELGSVIPTFGCHIRTKPEGCKRAEGDADSDGSLLGEHRTRQVDGEARSIDEMFEGDKGGVRKRYRRHRTAHVRHIDGPSQGEVKSVKRLR